MAVTVAWRIKARGAMIGVVTTRDSQRGSPLFAHVEAKGGTLIHAIFNAPEAARIVMETGAPRRMNVVREDVRVYGCTGVWVYGLAKHGPSRKMLGPHAPCTMHHATCTMHHAPPRNHRGCYQNGATTPAKRSIFRAESVEMTYAILVPLSISIALSLRGCQSRHLR